MEEDLFVVITKQTMEKFLKEKNPSDLIALYTFYYYTAKWQKTNKAKATTSYTGTALNWGEQKVRKVKKQLIDFGVIEDVEERDGNGQITGHYIKIKYILKGNHTCNLPQGGENHSVENVTPNALRENSVNALSTGKETIVVLTNNDIGLYREDGVEVLSCDNTPLKERKHPQTRYPNEVKYIVGYLNQTVGTHYRANTDATKKHIIARLNEGFTIEDFETVINFKSKEWLGTKYSAYLRPETLFGSKFESYLNQATLAPKNILDNVTADDLDDVFDRF